MSNMDPSFTRISVSELLHTCANEYGNSPAITAMYNESLVQKSFIDFERDCAKVSSVFKKNGLSGDYILIDAQNDYETITCIYASMISGNIAVPINLDLPDDIIESVLTRLTPTTFICHEENLDVISYFDAFSNVNILKSSDIRNIIEDGSGNEFINLDIDPKTPSLVILTSGSTGLSKLVLNYHELIIPGKQWWPKRGLSACPLYHMYGIALIMDFLCAGAHIMVSDIKHCIENIDFFKPSELMGVPSFLTMVMKQYEAGKVDISSLRFILSCSAPQNADTLKKYTAMGVESHDEYGATETGTTLGKRIQGGDPEGSVGYILDDPVIISEEGEVLVHKSHSFLKYIADEDATNQALYEDYYHTGDKGIIKDGFLYITGRFKNLIILSNGENISPERIENFFSKYSQIEEIVVKGSDDDTIVAYVYPKDGNAEFNHEIEKFVSSYNRTVPSYYRIGSIIFRDKPFEKTASNKILRNKI